MIKDFFQELSTTMANNYIEELKKKNPKELDQMILLFNNLSDVVIEILKISPEFRTKFAKIHSEFMKYPESNQVIEESIKAYRQYSDQNK